MNLTDLDNRFTNSIVQTRDAFVNFENAMTSRRTTPEECIRLADRVNELAQKHLVVSQELVQAFETLENNPSARQQLEEIFKKKNPLETDLCNSSSKIIGMSSAVNRGNTAKVAYYLFGSWTSYYHISKFSQGQIDTIRTSIQKAAMGIHHNGNW